MNQQQSAAEALATVQTHQAQAQRAARVPWWAYVAMFVLCAGITASNDFISLGGQKLIAVVILATLAVTLVLTFASSGRTAPLDRVRGVSPRRPFVARLYGPMLLINAAGFWLFIHYGAGFAQHIADAIGLGHYPNTVAGVIFGALFTALFGAYQLLLAGAARRERA